jgi:hypothetical protein
VVDWQDRPESKDRRLLNFCTKLKTFYLVNNLLFFEGKKDARVQGGRGGKGLASRRQKVSPPLSL